MTHTIESVFRANQEFGEVVLLPAHMIGNKKKDSDKYPRNSHIIVRNLENKQWVVAKAQGNSHLKKGTAIIPYDMAVSLGIDMSNTFRTSSRKSTPVELKISKAGFWSTNIKGIDSTDSVKRSTTLLALVGIINLVYTVLVDAINFVSYLTDLLLPLLS